MFESNIAIFCKMFGITESMARSNKSKSKFVERSKTNKNGAGMVVHVGFSYPKTRCSFHIFEKNMGSLCTKKEALELLDDKSVDSLPRLGCAKLIGRYHILHLKRDAYLFFEMSEDRLSN